ncbi:hypothetical protein LIER_21629 [Lithospermum erythrorhizon]|uniref:GAG-pre-integrase domain-containing protein n=1 Tax=Lithospermum erythrorhizon TaxID=34254 RepID=A0AAV3QSG2_LITER
MANESFALGEPMINEKLVRSLKGNHVTFDDGGKVMHGMRSAANCYMWRSVQAMSSRKGEDAELWHKKLGHTNYRNIQQIIFKGAVRGILSLDVKDQSCGECQVENQTKSCHQKQQQVLDLGVELNEEYTDDGSPVNDTWSNDKGQIVEGKGVDDTCDDSCPVQLANHIQKNHPVDNIIVQLDQGVTTRRKEPIDYRKMVGLMGKDVSYPK